jgi:hypothetical protein
LAYHTKLHCKPSYMARFLIFSVEFPGKKTIGLLLLFFFPTYKSILFSQTIYPTLRFNSEIVAYSWHNIRLNTINESNHAVGSGKDKSYRISSGCGNNYILTSEFNVEGLSIPIALSIGLNIRNIPVLITKKNQYHSSDNLSVINNTITSKYSALHQYAGVSLLFQRAIKKLSNYWVHSGVSYGLSYNVLVHQKIDENSHEEHLVISRNPFNINDSNDLDITTTGSATDALGYAPQKGFALFPINVYFDFRIYRGLFIGLQAGTSLLPYDRFYTRHYNRHLSGGSFSFGISYAFEKQPNDNF